MESIRQIVSVFQQNSFLTFVFFFGAGGILISAVLGYVFKDTGIYLALWMMILGLLSVALLWGKGGLKTGITCFALLATFGGGGYLSLFSVLAIKKAVSERKQRRLEQVRTLSYVLPNRDNSYVRTRLQTALNQPTDDGESKRDFYLGHARDLLAKVQSAPLSTAEQLEAEEIAKLLGLYMKKDGWTASDRQTANDLFSRVLKLSAKYAV